MRALWVLLLCTTVLSGCAASTPKAADEDATKFSDIDVKATETTGVLLGVAVDAAIRPLPGVSIGVTGPTGALTAAVTDNEGRFAYDNLEPGVYFVTAKKLNFKEAATTATVEAGVQSPPVLRVQLIALFSQTPFSEQILYDGFLACAYSFSVSSTCVNDYTRVSGERCVPTSPPQCYCAGGCFRDQNLASRGGNIREYVSRVGPDWTSIIFEETWKPTSDAGKTLGFTVSYFSRPSASHWFGSVNGPSPIRLELISGEKHASAQIQTGTPAIIPPEGFNETFTFFGAGDGSLVLNQQFRSFETHFYFGLPPEGWSFVKGDPLPF